MHIAHDCFMKLGINSFHSTLMIFKFETSNYLSHIMKWIPSNDLMFHSF